MLQKEATDSPNLIAFCGDRGEGKTSCMCSVVDMVTCSKNNALIEIDSKLATLRETTIEKLDLIDPAFFDKKRNLLEHVVGQLYNKFKKYVQEDDNGKAKKKNVQMIM